MTKKRDEISVLKAINELPEEWLEACYAEKTCETTEPKEAKAHFGKAVVKWAVAATLALLLCGGGVAYAAKLGLFKFEIMNQEIHGKNFFLTVEAEKISLEELTGDISEMEELLREYMAEEEYSQIFPTRLKVYRTIEEARKYVGYAGFKETKVDGYLREAYVFAMGDKEGNLAEISLDALYSDGKISISEKAEVYTVNSWRSTHGTGVRMLEEPNWDVSFQNEEFVTKNGKEVSVVYEIRGNEKVGNRFMTAALVDGAVYYELTVFYYPQDLERAKEIMYEWCEQF